MHKAGEGQGHLAQLLALGPDPGPPAGLLDVIEGVADRPMELLLDGLAEFLRAEGPGDADTLGGREAEVVAVLPRLGTLGNAGVADVSGRVAGVVSFAELSEVFGPDRSVEAEFLGPEPVPPAVGLRGLGVVGGRGEREIISSLARPERSDGE